MINFEDPNKLIVLNESRKTIYSFLARVYAREVTIDFLNNLMKRKESLLNFINTPEFQDIDLVEGFRNLVKYIESLKEDNLENAQLALAIDYAGLFLGVWQIIPHPSESVYLSENHLLMQEPRDKVLEMYEKIGLAKSKDYPEPEDHIAVELAFMAHLCEKTVNALKNRNYAELKNLIKLQQDFLSQHLGKWVPMLTKDIIKGAKQEFYKAIAKITKAFIELDKRILCEKSLKITK